MGTFLIFLSHDKKMRNVPILLVALLAGCHGAPEQKSVPAPPEMVRQPETREGGGGIAEAHSLGDELAKFALTLRGIRYRFGGATLDGFDCSGLVFFAHRHF